MFSASVKATVFSKTDDKVSNMLGKLPGDTEDGKYINR